jgi:hypothetical protein
LLLAPEVRGEHRWLCALEWGRHRPDLLKLLRRLALADVVRHLNPAEVECHARNVVGDAVRRGQTAELRLRPERPRLNHRESRLLFSDEADTNAGAAIIARKMMAKKIS